MNQLTTSNELLISHIYTKNNFYALDVVLMQFIKATTLVSLVIDSIEVLDMDNFLFVNVEREINSIKITKVNLQNNKNSVIEAGKNPTYHACIGFLKVETVLEQGYFSHITGLNLLMKGSLFLVNFIPNNSSYLGTFTVKYLTATNTLIWHYDGQKPLSIFSLFSESKTFIQFE